MFISGNKGKFLETSLIAAIHRKDYLEGQVTDVPTEKNKNLLQEANRDCYRACDKLADYYHTKREEAENGFQGN